MYFFLYKSAQNFSERTKFYNRIFQYLSAVIFLFLREIRLKIAKNRPFSLSLLSSKWRKMVCFLKKTSSPTRHSLRKRSVLAGLMKTIFVWNMLWFLKLWPVDAADESQGWNPIAVEAEWDWSIRGVVITQGKLCICILKCLVIDGCLLEKLG